MFTSPRLMSDIYLGAQCDESKTAPKLGANEKEESTKIYQNDFLSVV